MDELLTVHDVALLCQLHDVTVRRHISAGRLPSVRVGKSVRVRREDLDTFIEPRLRQSVGTTGRKARPFTMDDPLWDIVGMIDSPDAAWVSSDKRRALAEAYTPKP